MFGKPQKALHLYIDEEKKSPKHVGETYAVLEKYDGWYMYVDFIDGEWGDIKSRAGRVIPSVQHLNTFKTIKPKYNLRVIFEGTIPGKEFQELNGIFNRKAPVRERVIFQVHDLITLDDADFVTRYSRAREVVDKIEDSNVKLVEVIYVGRDKDRWKEEYDKILSRGGEGIILKQANAQYQPDKRNHTLMKIKCEISLDLVVVGVVKGTGKYANTLGALQVQDSTGFIHTVSGMNDAERDYFWTFPDEIIGKVVEVQAMKRISNGSLREPRFKAIRYDKSVNEID